MKKYFSIAAFLIVCNLQSLGQDNEQWKIDSLKIDSLKKQLLFLRDTASINCLNSLAWEYFQTGKTLKFKADSAYPYAIQANREATKIDYKKGIAYSVVNLGTYEKTLNTISLRSGRKDSTTENWEQYIRQAIFLGNEIHDDNVLGWAYGDLGHLQLRKFQFDKAIENYKKSIFYFKRLGNEEVEGEMCTWVCMIYSERGDYEKGIEYCQKSMQLNLKEIPRKKNKEYRDYLVQQSLINMAQLFEVAGDYETALGYLRQSRQFAKENNSSWQMEAEMGELFTRMEHYDSAFYYLQKFTTNNPRNIWSKMWLGETYLATKEYDKALNLLYGAIDSFRTRKTAQDGLMRALIDAGRANMAKKNYKAALQYANEGFILAQKQDARLFIMEGYELLAKVYYHLGKNEKAYQYLLKHTELKDSILNRQFLWKLNNYKHRLENEKKEAKISLLNKDNKIKEQQLKQEAQLKKFLIFGLLGLILIGIFVFRNLVLKRKNAKLQSQKQQVELQQKAIELEMQALRAQMNPHFIFNCLSSINRFILKNETETASDYLTRFSRLIRMVLINSQKPMIPLEDEMEMIRLYLDMERLRFKNSFDYNIIYTNTIEAGSVFIPPLLLQPFCENAIWHGLMHKEGQGQLDISLSMQKNILHCIITDNGVGRKKAAELKSKSAEKEKSLGLKITTDRLALLNRDKDIHTFYEMNDLTDENGNAAGTKVILKIGYKEAVEELE